MLLATFQILPAAIDYTLLSFHINRLKIGQFSPILACRPGAAGFNAGVKKQ